MTGNKCYLTEYEDYDGGFVSFRDGKGRISGKGKIKIGTLDFDNVYFCKELKYNLFSVSQICDKKNNVLFTDTECLVLSSDFKLLDESQVLLRVPRKDNIYSVDLKSVVPTKGLTCLFAKATIDESNLWHMRLGHTNFKNMNKLVRGNLVRGLPLKIFENDHSYVACQKGKQHKASYKAKLLNSISKPLHMLHMDLFGPTNVKSLMKNSYCLVITGIKKEFSVARTPQQNGVVERRNKILIEAARTMLVDSKLQTTFWAEAVNTACYVLNRVLVVKPHNKTPYELILDENEASDKDEKDDQVTRSEFERLLQQEKQNEHPNSTNSINTVSTLVSTAGLSFTYDDQSSPVNAAEASNTFVDHLFERFSPFRNAFTLQNIPNVTPINDTGIFDGAYDDEVGANADPNNLETTMNVNSIPTTRINKDH
ncbi:putative ribonuclease H-like domain-containing protein [Tanacetum coccineum]